MQTLNLLVGLPGSGKSTYAKQFFNLYGPPMYSVINYDNLRWYDNGTPVNYIYSKENEKIIKQMSDENAQHWYKLGYNLIIDNTNLTESARNHWKEFADKRNMKFEITEFNTDLNECLRRNALRTGWKKVPRAVIERMALNTNRIFWPIDQKSVLVDMDGTLADLSDRHKWISKKCFFCIDGYLSPTADPNPTKCPVCFGTGSRKKDWNEFYKHVLEDKPIRAVIEWVKSLKDQYYVCIVSGRPLDKAGVQTEQWLEKYQVPYDRLFMRQAGDKRDDVIVKQEILDKITRNIQIAFCIDDRPRVIRMWRENGLTCYDVGNGVEF